MEEERLMKDVDKIELTSGGTTLLHNHPVRGLVGSFICPPTIGIYPITGLGFKPKILNFFVSKNSGISADFLICQGLADDLGNQNVSSIVTRSRGVTKGETRFDRCIEIIDWDGNILVSAVLVSMDVDGFTLNFIQTDSSFVVRGTAQ